MRAKTEFSKFFPSLEIMTLYERELQVAIMAVRKAAMVVTKARKMLGIIDGVAQKADQSPVTGIHRLMSF